MPEGDSPRNSPQYGGDDAHMEERSEPVRAPPLGSPRYPCNCRAPRAGGCAWQDFEEEPVAELPDMSGEDELVGDDEVRGALMNFP